MDGSVGGARPYEPQCDSQDVRMHYVDEDPDAAALNCRVPLIVSNLGLQAGTRGDSSVAFTNVTFW
jgi:hypothetical protein